MEAISGLIGRFGKSDDHRGDIALFTRWHKSTDSRLFRLACWSAVAIAFCVAPVDRRAAGTAQEQLKGSSRVAPEPLANRHALIIGVNRHDDDRIPSLQFAESDASLLYETLTDSRVGRFDPGNVSLLLGKDANVSNLRRYFGRLRRVEKDDLVFIYFSGHGAKEAGEAFWVTPDTEMDNLAGTALSNSELKLFLDRIPSERVVVVLDCCYAQATIGDSETPTKKTSKAALTDFSSLWRPFSGKGRVVIAAAGSGEEAFESGSFNQGVFTYFLVQGLKGAADTETDGIINASELWRYLNIHVAEESTRVDGAQIPTLLVDKTTPIDQFLLTFNVELLKLNRQRIEKLMDLRAQGTITASEFSEARQLLSVPRLRERERQRKEIYVRLADGTTDAETARLALLALSPQAPPGGSLEPFPVNLPRTVRNCLRMDLTLIPQGSFQMGSKLMAAELAEQFGGPVEWFEHEQPSHLVRISQPFYLGVHEVTVGQFKQFVQETGYRTEAERGEQDFQDGLTGGYTLRSDGTWGWRDDASWRNPGFEQSDDHPVVLVSWNDAMAFCRWLSTRDNRPYRLPTEAEWEHACRAGSTTMFWWGDDPEAGALMSRSRSKYGYSMWLGNDIDQADGHTQSAGNSGPNGFGLFDITGNVWEWCGDYYTRDYYSYSPMEDPPGPESGMYRVIRGGSWQGDARYLRSARRNGYRPNGRHGLIGFRVAAETY